LERALSVFLMIVAVAWLEAGEAFGLQPLQTAEHDNARVEQTAMEEIAEPLGPEENDQFDEPVQPLLDVLETSPSPSINTFDETPFLLSAASGGHLPWRYAELFKDVDRAKKPSRAWEERSEEFPSIYNLPIIRSSKVESHIRYFQIAIRAKFEQWLSRFGQYRHLVESIFSEFDLPADLVYLSLVESGFNPRAYSRARAMGPWQFMRGTAKLYGLRVDRYVDERRDPIKSTVAAARYLRDLYDLFGTWHLAMAAYNAGEGKVMRALQKSRAETYWEISQTKHIRRETKEYVPRFMAATIIARNPSEFGFPEDQSVPHHFEEVIVRRPVYLQTLAAATGIPLIELRRFNPELRIDTTPPDVREYHLKIPPGVKERVARALEMTPAWKAPSVLVKGRIERSDSPGWYKVQVGDSLWTIAKRFRLTVQELKARNRLTSHGIKPGDLLSVGSPH
jgi:membrane-bound lytic murein transglycosylase D